MFENCEVWIAVIKSTKTKVVVMVTNARRHPYIDFMKSSSDDYKVNVGMSPCIIVTITTTLVLVLYITAI